MRVPGCMHFTLSFAAALFSCVSCPTWGETGSQCDSVSLGASSISVFKLSANGVEVFFFKGRMSIDFDGAPNAYAPKGAKDPDGNGPLDHLANAGHQGEWWGLETDTGKKDGNPLIQGPRDPFPGFYISTTALQKSGAPVVSRNVDARKTPYIVLPSKSFNRGHGQTRILHNAKLGDFAAVINSKTGQIAGAVFADTNQRTRGEGSLGLAQTLGLASSGADDDSIYYVVFPKSGKGWPPEASEIDATAKALFDQWGGVSQLKSCLSK